MNREETITLLLEAMNNTKRSMHGRMHSFTQDLAVSLTQLELLFTLKQMQTTTTMKLAKHMHVTPGAISQMVGGLVKLEFVRRTSDPNDRRTQSLTLSPKGVRQMSKIEKSRHELLQHVMSSLSDEELSLLLRVQEKMVIELNTFEKEII